MYSVYVYAIVISIFVFGGAVDLLLEPNSRDRGSRTRLHGDDERSQRCAGFRRRHLSACVASYPSQPRSRRVVLASHLLAAMRLAACVLLLLRLASGFLALLRSSPPTSPGETARAARCRRLVAVSSPPVKRPFTQDYKWLGGP
jgi:hypothetical protein